MAHTLTSDQETVLGYEDQDAVYGIKIDLSTPLYYCTGDNPVTLGGDVYSPHEMIISGIPIGPASSSSASITLADQDGTLVTLWYSERFTGVTVTITEALLKDDATWVVTKSLPWICTGASRDASGNLSLRLSGAGGTRPRAGLKIASRRDFPFAPEPGTIIRLLDGNVVVD